MGHSSGTSFATTHAAGNNTNTTDSNTVRTGSSSSSSSSSPSSSSSSSLYRTVPLKIPGTIQIKIPVTKTTAKKTTTATKASSSSSSSSSWNNSSIRMRWIVEDLDTFHSNGTYKESYFSSLMVDEFFHPIHNIPN